MGKGRGPSSPPASPPPPKSRISEPGCRLGTMGPGVPPVREAASQRGTAPFGTPTPPDDGALEPRSPFSLSNRTGRERWELESRLSEKPAGKAGTAALPRENRPRSWNPPISAQRRSFFFPRWERWGWESHPSTKPAGKWGQISILRAGAERRGQGRGKVDCAYPGRLCGGRPLPAPQLPRAGALMPAENDGGWSPIQPGSLSVRTRGVRPTGGSKKMPRGTGSVIWHVG